MSNSRQIASLPNILTLIDDAGGQFIKQQAAATTTSYTITWPAAVGGSGRLLGTTDGSGTLGWLNSVSVAVSGGTVDNSIIGGSTPAAITGTTIVANSGFTGALTGNATTATALATGRTFSFTGDATGTSGAFTGAANASTALTLAASGVNAGSYGSATAIPVLTIDAKGRITSASTASISSSLTIAADSGSNDTVGVGTDTLTFAGTSNEIETTVSNNQIQIGLPSTVSGLTTVNATNLQGALAGTIASTTTAVTQAASDNTTKVATTAYVNTALANLVDSAPAALDTLNELAAAMGDDANFSTTVTNSIATKLALAGGTMTGNLDLNDNVKIRVGTGQDLEIYHDPSLSINNIISPSGSILFGVQTSGSFTYKLGSTQKFQIASGAVVIADALRTPIVTGNSLYGIDFQQQALLPYSTNQTIDNTVDLGSSSKQFRNIYGVNIYADTGITGTLLTAAQTNITSVGTLGSLNVSGTVTANAFSGTVTGNITGNVTGNVSGSAATVTGAAQSAITSVGTLTSLAVSGDVTVDTSVFKVDTSNNRVGILNASPDVTLDIGSATDSIHIPVGTTAQRPGSPAAGYFRYNSSLSQFEGYTSAWGAIGGGGTNTFNHNVFTGDGSTTAFALAAATESENNLLVFIDGVFQEQGAYSIATSGGTTTLTMSAAPASGRKLVVYQVSAGVSGSNLNIDTMTGDGSDTTLTLSIAPVNENNTQVFFDGVYQNKSTYSISGTTLTFSTAPPTGVAVEVMTFTQTEVNVPVNDTVDTVHLKAGAVTAAKIESSLDLSSKSLTLPAVAVPSASTATTQSASDNTTKIATTAYVTTAIANLIDGAPGTLNTLNELAAALADDAAFSSTITTSLAAKANLAAPNFTGNVTFDTTTLTVDATNNRVGIGTASPNRQLSLYHASQAEVGFKTGSVSNGALIYYNDTENKLLLRAQETSDHIEFQTGGITERMRIDSSGNVGIGTSSIATNTKLHVKAGTNLNFEVENSSSTLRLSALNDARSANVPMQFASSSFQFITGNVGIGGNPAEKLNIIGTGGTAKLRFDGDSSNLQNNFIGITAYDDLIIASDEANTGTASTIQFRIDATERMRIDSSGNVGIGTANGDVTGDGSSSRTYVGIIGTANRGRLNLGTTASNGADAATLAFTNGANTLADISVDTNSGVQNAGKMYISSTDLIRLTTGGVNAMQMTGSGGIVVNNDQNNNINFTVKAGAKANALVVDGQSGHVGVGAAPDTTGFGGTFQYLGANGGSGYGIFNGQTTSTTAGHGAASFFGSTTGSSGYKLLGGMQVVNGASSSSNAEGDLVFYTATGGSLGERMRIRRDGEVDIKLNTNAYGTFSDNIGEVGSGNFCLQVANSAGSALKPLGFRAEDIRFATGSATRMTVNSNGNVNIGMPSGYNAEGKLHVYNGASGKSYAADAADQLILENNSSVCFDIRTPSSNNGVILFSDESARGSGQINYSHNGDTMYFYTGGGLRASLNSSGLALTQASTTDPVLTLTDSGVADYFFTFPNTSIIQLQCNTSSDKEFKVTNTGSGRIDFNVEGYCYSGNGFWFNTDTDTGIYRNDTNSISFRGAGNDRFTIDGDTNATQYSHMFSTYHASSSYNWYVGTNGNVFNFYDGAGNQRGYVNSSGFQNGSDVAYKENIVDINRGLTEVLQLKPRKFDIKDTIDMKDSDKVLAGDKDELGFIAQELETAIPELVKGEEGSKTIGYAQLTAVLTKAIQEQQVLIEALQTKVAALEGE